jgi:hypothetical protein
VGLFDSGPPEPFLNSKLRAFVSWGQAIEENHFDKTARLKVVLPPECTGCLEESSETWPKPFDVRRSAVTGVSGNTTTVSTTTLRPVWEIPMCAACADASLLKLTEIKSVDSSQGTWLVFGFANVGYLLPFAQANKLDPDECITGKIGVLEPKKQEGALQVLEEQLKPFHSVRERFGFHRYLAARTALLELDRATSRRDRRKRTQDVRAAIERCLAEHGLTLDDAPHIAAAMAGGPALLEVLRS